MGSVEMREDIALVTEKKAELAAVLRQAITIIRGGNVNPTGGGGGGGGGVPPPPARSGGAGGTAARSKMVAECNFDYDAQQVLSTSIQCLCFSIYLYCTSQA